ncbi:MULTISPECIES: OPT family oligopeptide transporter [unclassified Fusibacter]|uniref:OPT family oligopeptide transporter n=1 Tax=unclassified Fusibacter TaxID=2624464 RepID=UPI0010138B62|nr:MULTISPECIES: oligopeptide transporter, OPT family [unclassified Fusibacter]MCK8058575.1 oligopeptide transporter, OPT family [Fusibacter sp. A2]NPE22655.1 oligopeptide transporter, OPT family [Fusibacter sp. A1]RXV60218.1 oligopeptide transporter, OPT family [Fusibacter sp. A1]
MKNNTQYKPYIAANTVLPELTITSIVMGIILAIIFGAVNAYLGLKVGMTISASIPAAVVSMSLTRFLMKRDSILENNMVQTIGSAGESLAAGSIFTIPAIFIWTSKSGLEAPTLATLTAIAVVGGLLGVLFMIPLRRALIVKEHGVLPYPEGSACADVLLAGETKGQEAKATFTGMFIGAVYKFLTDGIHLFASRLAITLPKPYPATIGGEFLPAIVGVGFIIGKRTAGLILSGSLLGWLVFIPLIDAVGFEFTTFSMASSSVLNPEWIWNQNIRYIGVGAVAFGGALSLISSLPLIYRTIVDTIKDYKLSGTHSMIRTEKDLPITSVLLGILILFLAMVTLPILKLNILSAIIVIILGYFFATISSRIVGLVGSSSNPISGMTMATLIFTGSIFKLFNDVDNDMIMSLFIVGSIICIIIAMAGDTSQDLKTGFIVGATPIKQQIGEMIGVIASASALGFVLLLFHSAWGFGTPELPAPQATLIELVVEGMMNGNLPWTLILVGVGVGIILVVLDIPVLPVAIGLYLPIHLSTVMFLGGLLRNWIEEGSFDWDNHKRKLKLDSGILFSSGLIAGEGVIGILFASLSAVGINLSLGIDLGFMGTLSIFSLLFYSLMKFSVMYNPNK